MTETVTDCLRECNQKVQAFRSISIDTIGSDDKVYKIVDTQPIFGNCKDKINQEELYKCSNQHLLMFIFGNLKYPKEARKKGISGKVYAQFIVRKDGTIDDIKIVRDIGYGCGDALAEVLSKMPNWTPAQNKGQNVNVLFTLPVLFNT